MTSFSAKDAKVYMTSTSSQVGQIQNIKINVDDQIAPVDELGSEASYAISTGVRRISGSMAKLALSSTAFFDELKEANDWILKLDDGTTTLTITVSGGKLGTWSVGSAVGENTTLEDVTFMGLGISLA